LKRVEGEKLITPDDSDKTMIAQSGGELIVASFKVCLDDKGAVSDGTTLESSGVSSYDAKLVRTMHKWRYEPVILKGKATAVCTGLTFVYNQS
jgi:outer membrane biosynthesis protein TonB